MKNIYEIDDVTDICIVSGNVGDRTSNITVMSVCTDKGPLLDNWKMSLEKQGYDYKIIGLGEKWGGWTWRTRQYIKAVSEIQEEKLVVLTDATDLFFIGPPQDLLSSFESYNSDVVVGAEHQCCTSWPRWNFTIKELILFHARKRNPNTRYVVPNGGFIMGYRSALLDVLCANIRQEDDQHGYLVNWLEHPDVFKLDTHARCVANFVYDIPFFDSQDDERVETDFYELRGKRLYSTETKSFPCVLHFPGGNAEAYNMLGGKIYGTHFNPMVPKKATVTSVIKKSWTMPIKTNVIAPFFATSGKFLSKNA